jgi:hypothetical protein
MVMTFLTFLPRALLILALIALVLGCGWVDSTGRQGNSLPESEIELEDGSVPIAIEVNEQSSIDLTVVGTDPDGDSLSWNWGEQPVNQGALSACASLENFPVDYMEQSLLAACADPQNCQVQFDELSNADNRSVFRITTPQLRASIGLVYNLFAKDVTSSITNTAYTFCLAAINEAPQANDDFFSVLEGNQLVITGAQVNLLSNDVDDDDISNQDLEVTRAVKQPLAASVFELRADGGFTYAFAGDDPITLIEDTFDYEITDGRSYSEATVTLRIVPRDDPPELISEIPMQSAIAGIDFESDISTYFLDPENSGLSFSVDEDDLPPSGGISISVDGVLSGTADENDEGRFTIPFSVSDGNNGLEASFVLEVLENEPVDTARSPLLTATVDERFTFAFGRYFDDPEDQVLSFGLVVDSSDAQVVINSSTGIVSGFFRDDGVYDLEITADDGFNDESTLVVVVEVRDES